MINKSTWIISDTHFGHKNIIKFCGRPENHEEIILNNWMSMVKDQDTTLHLGDVMFGGRYSYHWAEQIAEIPGEKLLIRGNHDHSKEVKILQNVAGFEIIDDFIQEFNGQKIYFSHYPDQPVPGAREWDFNIHGHIHNNGYDPLYFPNIDQHSVPLYFNASIEETNYKPVRLVQILAKLNASLITKF